MKRRAQKFTTPADSLALRAEAEQIAETYLESSRIGRPPRATDPDAVELLLAYLRDGNYRETALKASGFSRAAFYRALEAAERGDEQAILFRDAIERAEAAAESETVRNVRKASENPQFWAAGMTWLERKSPDKWSRRQDDSNTPKVVIQLGVVADRVQINAFAPTQSPVSPDLHSLTADTESDK